MDELVIYINKNIISNYQPYNRLSYSLSSHHILYFSVKCMMLGKSSEATITAFL